MRDHGVDRSPDTTAHLRREFTETPDEVWRALTDPVELTTWFWPARLRPQVSADARPGGRFRIASAAEGFAMAASGEYRVVQPRRLEFTWTWDGEPADTADTLVTIELSGMDGGGTRLELTHVGFPDVATRDDHVTGWSDCLDRLRDRATAVATQPRSPQS